MALAALLLAAAGTVPARAAPDGEPDALPVLGATTGPTGQKTIAQRIDDVLAHEFEGDAAAAAERAGAEYASKAAQGDVREGGVGG